jgi:dUTP pyrophosphatase
MSAVRIVNQSPWPLPAYATAGSAGMDIQANLTEAVTLNPGQRLLIPTGLFIELPSGLEAQLRPRSGLAFKHGITLPNSPATIDSDYRGEIRVALINLSAEPYIIQPGDRIAQLVIARYECIQWTAVDQLNDTARGSGGFGSTGQ